MKKKAGCVITDRGNRKAFIASIVEVRQDEELRVQCGKKAFIALPETLHKEVEKVFLVTTLTDTCKCYVTYLDRILEPIIVKLTIEKSQPLVTKLNMNGLKTNVGENRYEFD